MAELLRGDVGSTRPRWSARVLSAVLTLILLLPFGPLLIGPAAAGEFGVCYAASNGNDVLYRLDRSDATETIVGDLDTTDPTAIDVTALAFRGTDLYGAQDGQLGTVSTATGAYAATTAPFGTGTGPSGSVTFSEVVGLATDVPEGGRMYGVHRDTGGDDVLFVVDPTTGAHVDSAFGAGIDHVRISGSAANIDDLAVHPMTGVLYGVTRDLPGTQQIVTIDETTGTVTATLPLVASVPGGSTASLTRVEGLSFAADGTLYATTGAGGTYPNDLFRIDLATGTATHVGELATATAVSGLACLHGTSRVDGVVYRDDDDSGTQTGSEPGLDGIVVELYEDVDGDGALDTGDRLLATETTAGVGAYLFDIAATGDFLLRPDPASLAAGASVTPDHRSVSITTVGTTITDQDFGVQLASITGTVFDDAGSDGGPDPGEGLGSITVHLTGPASQTTATVSDGSYRFDGLPGGSYQVTVDVPSGYEAVTSLPVDVSLAADQDLTGVDIELDRLVADVAVTKDVDDATAQVDQTITYRIEVTNTGPDEATDVTVIDHIPGGVSAPRPAPGTPAGIHDDIAGTYTWELGTLPAQTTATVLELLVDVDDPANAENVVEVTTSAQDPDAGNDSASADLEVADLSITKTVDDPDPVADQVVTFTMVLDNAATSDEANGITVTDALPAGLTYVSSNPTGTYGQSGHDVTWTLASLPAGTQTTFTVDARVTASGGHTNTVAVTAVDEHDPDPGDETASVTLSPQEADLELDKSVDTTTPLAGDDVSFTIRVTNHGPGDATGVTVADTLPVGLEYVPGSGGTYDSATRTVTWTVPTIVDGAFTDLTFDATATFDAATGVDNDARVTSMDQFDPGTFPNQDSVHVDAVAADLTVDLAGPATAPDVGDTITVSVTADDLGPDPATEVTATVTLAPGLAWASGWTPPAGFVIDDASTGTWTIGGLAVDAAPSIDLSLDVGPGAVDGADVTATISGTEPDPDAGNDTSVLTVDAQDVDLTLTKTTADVRPQVGDTVTFELGLTNDSGDTATGVTVQDVLPAGLTFSSATGSGATTYDAATGVWDVGVLGPGGAATLTLAATVDGSVLTRIENTATVADVDQHDTDPRNDTAAAELDPVDVDLQVTKSYVTASGTATRPEVGERITFTVVVTNLNGATITDGATATGVAVSDPPTAGLTDPQLVGVDGTVDLSAGNWTVGDVPAGESRTLRYSVLVDVTDLATVHLGVTNTATVTASQYDRDGTNDSYDRLVDPFDADVSLDKQLTSGSAAPQVGDQVEFTVTVTNAGPDPAPGVVVEDTLATGLALVSATSSAPATVVPTGAVTTWSLSDPLAAAGTATLTVVAEVVGDGHAGTANTAEVTAVVGNGGLTRFDPDSTPDDGSGDDHDQVVLDPQDADLRLTKTVDEPAPRFGDPVGFTVTLANDGPDTAHDIEVADSLPSTFDRSTALITATHGSYDVGTGVWDVGDLAASVEATLTITATTTTGGTYTNAAEVTAVLEFDPDSTPANHDTAPNEDDSATAAVTVDDPASVTGIVWDDVDGDGIRDGDEVGLAGVVVTLTSTTDGAFTRTATTDTLGVYTATGLPRDTYEAAVTGPPATPYEPSMPDPPTITVTLTAGEDRTGVDFGFWQPASISGLVWLDLDEDRSLDMGEPTAPPVPVTVELYADTDTDGSPDGTPLDSVTVGTSDGSYTFDELPPGDYVVVVPETVADAYVLTTDNSPRPLHDVVPAQTVPGIDFGYAAYDPAVSITAGTSVRAEAATTVVHPHRVKNDGNVGDTYDLTATSSEGWTVELWEDVDGDGALDSSVDRALASPADTGAISEHGGTFDLLAVVDVPGGTPRGTVDTLTVTATSRIDPALDAQATDTTTVIAPRIEVDKTSSTATGSAVPGRRIDYRIEVRNVDDAITATALDVDVDDELADPSHGTIDGATIAVDGDSSVPDSFPVALGDLASGDLRVITFQVVVSRPLPDGTVIVNTATATAGNPEGDLLADQDSTADTVSSSAIPQLTKTAVPVSGSAVDPADTITYQLVVANRSDATDIWRDVTATDAEPGTTTQYVVGSARLNGAPVADDGSNPFAAGFALGDLSPGATVTLTFEVTVNDPVADGAVIVNVAEATGANTGPSFASVSHVVEVDPAVSLTPDRSGTVEPPGTVTYAHVLRNDGDVTDTYDLAATSDHAWVVELRHDVDGDGQIDAGEPIVTDRTLGPGEVSRLTVTVTVPAGVPSGTVDTITVVATSRTDPAVTDSAFDATTAVTGELEVRKSADPSSSVVNPGMDVSYSIEVENVGGAPARDVLLTDDTPASTTYRQGTTTWDGVPVPDDANGDRNPVATVNGGLRLGDLAPGAVATVRFTVRVGDPLPDDTLILNVAEAEGSPGLTAQDSVTQIVRSSPVFDLDKSADITGTVEPRQRIAYTVSAANVGNEAATSVVLTDATPSGTDYVPGSATVNGSAVPDDGTNPLDPSNGGLDLPDLPVGGPPVTVAFAVTVADPIADGTVITNEATVASGEGVSAPSPRVQHTVTVAAGVTLGPDRSADVVIPGVAVHAHDVTNTGNVTDTFALAATSSEGWVTTLYADDDGDGAWDSSTETTAVNSTGPVPPGGRFPLIAIVDVPATAVPGTVDTTTVSATSSTDPAIDASATDLTRAVAPALRVTKTATPSGDQVNAGQVITYAVTVRNVGDGPADDVVVVDDTPSGTAYVPGSATAGTSPVPDAAGVDPNPFSAAAGGYTVGELAAGATVTLSFEVRVSTTVAVGTHIVNTATARGAHTADPIAATRVHTVTSGPVLDLRKTAEPAAPGPVTARQQVTYEIVLRNIGQEPATGVRVTDDTPIDTTYVHGSTTIDGVPVTDGSLDPNPLSSQYAGYAVGDLQPDGTPVTVRFTVEVVDPVPEGGTVVNAASATSTEGATATTPPVEHDIDVHPAVRLGPDGTLPVLAGGTAVHALSVTNEGDVTDVYTFDADTSRGWTLVLRADPDGDGGADPGEPEIAATGSLAPGETYPVTLAVTAPDGAVPGTTDTTVVRAVSTGDVAVRDAATLATHVVAGRLSLQKTASPLSVTPDSRATYTLTVSNTGDAPATEVMLTDPTPAGTTYVRGSTQRDGRQVADRAGGDGNPLARGLALGTLAPGASTIISFRVDVRDEPDREVIVNAAGVSAADALPARAGTTQPISRTHALDLSPPGEETIRSGTAVHAHTLTNTGDVADEVVVSATSDQGYPVTVYRDADADGSLDDPDPALTAPIALAPDQSAALLVAVTVPEGTPGGTEDVTTVTATSLGDPVVAVSISDVTRVVAPALVITKEVAPGVAVAPDTDLTFTIVVTNDGNAAATDLVITDPTPAGTAYVPGSVTVDGAPVADAAGDDGAPDTNPLDDRNGGVTVPGLEPGGEVTVRFRATVRAEVVSGTDLTNVAFVTSAGTGMLSSPPVSVQVHGSSSLVIAKGVDTPGVVGVGTPVTWAVQVTNVSTETAADVVITDHLPPGVAYQPGTTTLDGQPVPDDAGQITGAGLQVGPIAPGGTRLVLFRTVTTGEAALVENVAVATHGASGASVLSNAVLIGVDGAATGGAGGFPAVLPQTGAPVTRTLGAGLILALAGWSLLFVARRQDPPSPVSRPRPPRRHDRRIHHRRQTRGCRDRGDRRR